MTDTVLKKKRSEIMSAVKSKETKIEIAFRKELWKNGLRYRKNPLRYFGKPDIVLKKHNVVIFIDSCFWHGCKKHFRMPSTREGYWKEKMERNIARDKEVNKYYKKTGWRIFRFWEHDINKNMQKAINKIVDGINHK